MIMMFIYDDDDGGNHVYDDGDLVLKTGVVLEGVRP